METKDLSEFHVETMSFWFVDLSVVKGVEILNLALLCLVEQ